MGRTLVPSGRSRSRKLAADQRHNRGVDRDSRIRAERGDVVVCVAVGKSLDDLERCLQSLGARTKPEVAIVLCGGSPPEGLARTIEESGRAIGLAPDLQAAFAAAFPADVVLVSSDCLVAEEWLDRLRDAAYSDSRVATAAALGDQAGHASVAISEAEFARAAAELRHRSPRIRPRVHVVTGPCLYIRRTALELVGDFHSMDEFWRRSLQSGLAHVVADDVLVFCRSQVASAEQTDERNDAATGPLSRAVGVLRGVVDGLSVAIDARILDGPPGGSRLHTLELIAALARTGKHRITAIVTPGLDPDTRAVIETLPGVRLTTAAAAGRGWSVDLVHRPLQVSAPADLALLAQLADRVVITQQDLIGHHNPSYFPSVDAWQRYRELTRRSLAAADRVLFFSAHARDEALADELVEAHRADVVPIGVDHPLTRFRQPQPSRPPGADRLPVDCEMLLCLGTDYRHKNRVFALRILEELRAGTTGGGGSSLPALACRTDPRCRKRSDCSASDPGSVRSCSI